MDRRLWIWVILAVLTGCSLRRYEVEAAVDVGIDGNSRRPTIQFVSPELMDHLKAKLEGEDCHTVATFLATKTPFPRVALPEMEKYKIESSDGDGKRLDCGRALDFWNYDLVPLIFVNGNIVNRPLYIKRLLVRALKKGGPQLEGLAEFVSSYPNSEILADSSVRSADKNLIEDDLLPDNTNENSNDSDNNNRLDEETPNLNLNPDNVGTDTSPVPADELKIELPQDETDKLDLLEVKPVEPTFQETEVEPVELEVNEIDNNGERVQARKPDPAEEQLETLGEDTPPVLNMLEAVNPNQIDPQIARVDDKPAVPEGDMDLTSNEKAEDKSDNNQIDSNFDEEIVRDREPLLQYPEESPIMTPTTLTSPQDAQEGDNQKGSILGDAETALDGNVGEGHAETTLSQSPTKEAAANVPDMPEEDNDHVIVLDTLQPPGGTTLPMIEPDVTTRSQFEAITHQSDSEVATNEMQGVTQPEPKSLPQPDADSSSATKEFGPDVEHKTGISEERQTTKSLLSEGKEVNIITPEPEIATDTKSTNNSRGGRIHGRHRHKFPTKKEADDLKKGELLRYISLAVAALIGLILIVYTCILCIRCCRKRGPCGRKPERPCPPLIGLQPFTSLNLDRIQDRYNSTSGVLNSVGEEVYMIDDNGNRVRRSRTRHTSTTSTKGKGNMNMNMDPEMSIYSTALQSPSPASPTVASQPNSAAEVQVQVVQVAGDHSGHGDRQTTEV